ncbi:hypothetical protein Angca_010131 [Angiostrongylus cantonensis]|nr:hypothetical protein Angca_010131 [Angiostrongylus cantonensis]
MMNRDSVVKALNATNAPDRQKSAESFLDECSKQQGFTPELLNIICDGSICKVIRQSAAIYFKNNVVRYWEAADSSFDAEEDIDPKRCLSDRDKTLIREHIIDAVCVADESYRNQLCIAVQEILRVDFPKNWQDFADKLLAKIRQSPDASTLSAALLIVYRFSKVYEFKRGKHKDVIVLPFSKIEPAISHHCFHSLDMQSTEAVSIQIQGLKIIYVLTQFSLNFRMLPASKLHDWIKFSIDILDRTCPEELDSIEDKEERAHTVWWKCKKWAAKLLDRLFQRYGSPNYVEEHYVSFARQFLTKWVPLALQSSLAILNARRNNVYVSDRVLHHMLMFTNNAVAHSVCWQIVKPHALDLIKHVLFPLLCYNDDDEEMWRENVEEYIRFKFDVFEDLHNPAYGAGALLIGLAKRKDVVQSVVLFAVQVLSRAENSREVEGALRTLGELYVQLTKNKKYKHNVEQMLKTLVIDRLRDPSKFVRARAAWCIKQYSEARFFYTETLAKIIESLVQCLCDTNEELPVQVESALAIQCLLKHQDKVHTLVHPSMGVIILKVLELLTKTKIEDVIFVVDEFLEQYIEDVVPVSSEVAEHLCHLFLEILGSSDVDDRTPTLLSIIHTLHNILDVVEGHMEIMVKVEGSVLKVINAILEVKNFEFYDNVVLLLQSILQSYVSEPMWDVFDKMYNVFKTSDSLTVLPFSELGQVLHLYIVTDTESFLAFPHRLAAVLDMCITVIKDDSTGDENHLYATKIMECILLECSSHTTEVIPTILMTVFERLTKPFEEGLSELKPLLLLVVIAALYVNLDVTLQAFHQIAPDHPNLLEYICDQFLSCYKKMEGIHNRRMALIGICLYFQLPPPVRPSLISTDPKKVLEVSLSIFENLLRAQKLVAQNKNEESDTDDSDEESNDESDGNLPKKGQCHRKVYDQEHLSDDEDEIDEMTLDYMDAIVKEDGRVDRDDEDGDSDSAIESSFFEETDSEAFTTKFDGENGLDVFVFFKRTMEEFERNEPELFLKMVANLSPNMTESLQNLIKECEQHAKSEESRKVEQAGGYSFDAAAVVPESFDFTQ